MDLGLSGLASGFDWKSVVDQLVDVERAPQRRARREQSEISEKNRILSLMKDELTALQNKSKALKDSDLLSIQDDFHFGFHNQLVLGFIRGGAG